MKTIYKYPLKQMTGCVVEIPEGHRTLHAAVQDGHPTVWAGVDTDKPLKRVKFNVVGTGWPLFNEEQRYVGTCHDNGLVWHIFEEV